MKKIRNIKDLENEKLRLRVKQLELEKQMDRSWKDLKNSFSTNDHVVKKPNSTFKFKTSNVLLNGALNFGSTFLSHQLGTIAGKTIENAAVQLIGRLMQKINSRIAQKKKLQKS